MAKFTVLMASRRDGFSEAKRIVVMRIETPTTSFGEAGHQALAEFEAKYREPGLVAWTIEGWPDIERPL